MVRGIVSVRDGLFYRSAEIQPRYLDSFSTGMVARLSQRKHSCFLLKLEGIISSPQPTTVVPGSVRLHANVPVVQWQDTQSLIGRSQFNSGQALHANTFQDQKMSSRSGNRTPGASVTGSNVTNYTNRDRALLLT